MQQIYFYNNTDLPIMIDYWIDEIWVENICCSHSTKIQPREKRMMYSCLGEWTLHSDFFNSDDTKLWKDKGLDVLNSNSIGKIVCKPNVECFIHNDFFCLDYRELQDEGINYGFITFSYKKMKID